MNSIERTENANSRGPETSKRRLGLWKPAFALGLLALVVVAVVVAVLAKPAGPVYAIEQTIEANRSLRSIHMVETPAGHGSVGEIWAQFDENGVLQDLRMNFPDTEDGPKDVVWENGKAQVWLKAKSSLLVVREDRLLERLKSEFGPFDPKLIVEGLYKKAGTGGINVDIKSPATKGDPITMTVTVEGAPNRQDVYLVDPETKLLTQRDVYRLQNGAYVLSGSTEYLDYNEPIDPSVFALEVPPGTTLVDQTAQEVGLAKGDLADNEIAVKVVREFFEALIAKDYAKAGQLLEGMPPAKMEEMFGPMKFTRILSIGEPTPYAANQSLKVPCKIEVERDGRKTVFEPFGPFVRPVYNQPGRWTICGGI